MPRPANVREVRQTNRSAVASAILMAGETTRAHIAERCELSQASVTNIVSDLIRDGLVRELDPIPSAGGRPIAPVSVAADGAHFIGADVGEQGVTVELFDLAMRPLDRVFRSIPTCSSTPRKVAAVVSKAIAGLRATHPEVEATLVGVGLGLPGIVDSGSDGRPTMYAQSLGWSPVRVDDAVLDRRPADVRRQRGQDARHRRALARRRPRRHARRRRPARSRCRRRRHQRRPPAARGDQWCRGVGSHQGVARRAGLCVRGARVHRGVRRWLGDRSPVERGGRPDRHRQRRRGDGAPAARGRRWRRRHSSPRARRDRRDPRGRPVQPRQPVQPRADRGRRVGRAAADGGVRGAARRAGAAPTRSPSRPSAIASTPASSVATRSRSAPRCCRSNTSSPERSHPRRGQHDHDCRGRPARCSPRVRLGRGDRGVPDRGRRGR